MVAATTTEVLPPLSWRSPENRASYFSVSDFQDGCTWLHLLLACLFLPDHSNLLVQVLPSWSSVTQHFLVLTKQYVIPSSLVDHQEMKIE